MNNILLLKKIEKAEKFLRFVKITLLTKVDFPSDVDLKILSDAKTCLGEVELLLNTENANSGQNGSANSGNAM